MYSDHPPTTNPNPTPSLSPTQANAPAKIPTTTDAQLRHGSKFCLKAARRFAARARKRARALQDDSLLDEHITLAEDERTAAAKANHDSKHRLAVENVNQRRTTPTPQPTFL